MGMFEQLRISAEKELSASDHDMLHVERVYNMCMRLAEGENVDMDVLKAAAILHDIAKAMTYEEGVKEHHSVLGARMAEPILRDAGFPEDKIAHVQECIHQHSYRGGLKPTSLEAMILFDADKLDATGAFGMARMFSWCGQFGAKLHVEVDDIDDYIKDNMGGKMNGHIKDPKKHSTQHEFEVKTKHLTKILYTEKGKTMCDERIAYCKSFLDRLDKEAKGEL